MAIEILRPNAPGVLTTIQYQVPDEGEHWDKVDEVEADGESTCVSHAIDNTDGTDVYALPIHSEGSGIINSVTVYICISAFMATVSKARAIVVSYGSSFYSSPFTPTPLPNFSTHSKAWTINPATESPWTWDEIDALQIGVELQNIEGETIFCTQVYVEVDYEVATPTVTTQEVTDIEKE